MIITIRFGLTVPDSFSLASSHLALISGSTMAMSLISTSTAETSTADDQDNGVNEADREALTSSDLCLGYVMGASPPPACDAD